MKSTESEETKKKLERSRRKMYKKNKQKMNNNQRGVLSLKTLYHEKEEATMVPAPVLTRERERKKKERAFGWNE